jgi:uncharacterized membrane protein HdeD (DUF308 family)
MLASLCNKWWCLLLYGLTAVIAGVISVTHPGLTVFLLAVMIGVNALIQGLMCVMIGIGGGGEGRPWWEMILLGLVGVGFGIAALAWPGLVIETLLVIVAAWAVVRGIFEIAAAIKLRHVIDDEWFLALSGVFSIAFGALLFARPISGMLAIGMVIGIFMFMYGLTAIGLSLRLRNLRNRLGSR